MGPFTHAAALLLTSLLAPVDPAPEHERDGASLLAGSDARDPSGVEGPASPPPTSEGDAPAPPPSAPAPGLEAPEQPGIELAPPPAAPEGPAPPAAAPSEDASYWPDPGTAPGDGIGALIGGVVLIPSAAVLTLLFIDPPIEGDNEGEISTIVAGAGLGAIGIGFLALSISRQLKLKRWASAYRVRPTFQGNGMLAAGGLALNYGLALGLAGTFSRSATGGERLALLCAGIGAAGLLAPPLLIFGKRARERYARSGGWTRPPLPPIPVSPSVQVLRQGFGLGLSGRF